jgi:hypothetical protein
MQHRATLPACNSLGHDEIGATPHVDVSPSISFGALLSPGWESEKCVEREVSTSTAVSSCF